MLLIYNEYKFLSNSNHSKIKHINNSKIKFIWKILCLIFEIIINITQFIWNFKINSNDVTKFFLWSISTILLT
jgi:hypothetical protein